MKEKLENAMNKIVMLTQNRYMKILTNSFMSIAAITIAGSLFTLVKSFPISAWQTFLTNSGIGDLLGIPVSITTDLIAVYVVLSLGYTLGKDFGENGFASAIISLGAFMLLTPFSGVLYNADYTEATPVPNVIPLSSLGAQGIFLAIITGLLASRLYVFFLQRGWKIKMPDSVPPAVSNMFEMMIPGGLTFLIFLVIRYGFSLTSYGTAQSFIYKILQAPLMSVGGGLAGVLVYVLAAKFLWLFGIHGGMICYSAMSPIIQSATSANLSAFAAGTACPYPEWAYASIMMDYGVLPMTIAMIIVCKSQQNKLLGRMTIPTSLFNISEPLVFGTPIIMNPITAIPFVLLQPLNLLLTLLVTNLGILPAPTGVSVSTMLPAFLQIGFATSSFIGIIWGLLMLVMDVVIWIPFIKVLDKRTLAEEAKEEAAEAKTVVVSETAA